MYRAHRGLSDAEVGVNSRAVVGVLLERESL